MQGGTQQRDGVDLVPCVGCNGNVRLKVPHGAPLPPGAIPGPDAFAEAVTMPLPVATAPAVGPSIVVIQTAYFLRPGREIVATDARWESRAADEQPYTRDLTLGETWTPLDLGWLNGKAGWVDIANQEGRRWERGPTDDERAAVARKVIEVSSTPLVDNLPEWEVAPGRSHAGAPVRPLFVRCRPGGGSVRVVVTAFPR